MKRPFRNGLVAFACAVASASLSAQHWPAFRGTNAAGVADGDMERGWVAEATKKAAAGK